MTAGRDVLRELRKKSAGVGAALAVAHLLRRWVGDDAGWLAEADEAP